jgi:protoporphyrinogen oxidase
MKPEFPIIILGGGITGLSAALLAADAGFKTVVLEASPEVGGLLNTFETAGDRLEYYYHHFFTHDQELGWLIKRLGLEDQVGFHATTMGVFRERSIWDFNSPKDLLKFSPMSLFDKFRFGITSLFLGKWADWKKYEGVSALEWFQKYAGPTTTASLWSPMLQVKFGPYAPKVPLAWMIGRLRQRMNSKKDNSAALGYMQGSLYTLLQALKKELLLKGVAIHTQSPVREVVSIGQDRCRVMCDHTSYEGKVLSTLAGQILSGILKPHYPDYSQELLQVEYFGAVCTILESEESLSPVYWLNIADPGFPFGGVIEHTHLVHPRHYKGSHLIYLSRYFEQSNPLASMSESEISTMMCEKLKEIFPHYNSNKIKSIRVFKTMHAATVCDLDFSKKVPHAQTPISGLYIANMAHIYPDERSCNNAIRTAANACALMGIPASHIPHSGLAGLIHMK